MAHEQIPLQLIAEQGPYPYGDGSSIADDSPWKTEKVKKFIEKWLDGKEAAYIEKGAKVQDSLEPAENFISFEKLNDSRFINKYLESINEKLPKEGLLIGWVEVSQKRKKRIMEKYPRPLNTLVYTQFYLLKRVWPKIPYLNRVFFLLTKGDDRVVSELETYGRLYSCGYKLLDILKTKGMMFFVAQKTSEPDYNDNATYSPIIKLRRVGKGGKLITVYKFRTMYPYSEYLQQYIYEKYGLQSGGKFKHDPRVNIIGQFSRKFWIDEIPMVVNILKGDLKLVGVRPVSRHYLSLYPEKFIEYRKRFKPGFIPPFYADMPETLEEIVESERKYLEDYEKRGFLADINYLYRALYNVFVKKARSN